MPSMGACPLSTKGKPLSCSNSSRVGCEGWRVPVREIAKRGNDTIQLGREASRDEEHAARMTTRSRTNCGVFMVRFLAFIHEEYLTARRFIQRRITDLLRLRDNLTVGDDAAFFARFASRTAHVARMMMYASVTILFTSVMFAVITHQYYSR